MTLNPMVRDETPRAAGDIVDRLNEILFNAPLLAELRAIAMAGEMISQGQLKHGSGPIDNCDFTPSRPTVGCRTCP